tara:strand:- start:213 stop:533 length:321 start_codon:yes stop_codon:yes gene_type:complete
MVSFTEEAIEALKKSIKGSQLVRICVKGGGCSGMVYDMQIIDEPKDTDLIIDFEEDNVKVCLDRQSAFFLDETVVDHETTLAQSGFQFRNGKATASCGCGKSFSTS